MSQSKIDCTRSGSAGSNWQLSSFRSLCTNDTRVGAGIVREQARRRRCPSRGGPSSGWTSSQRVCQPVTWRSTKPSGRPSVVEVGGRRVEEVHVGHRVDEGERDPPPDVLVVGHRRRDVVADDLAAAALHDHEVGADHGVVVAEQVGPRRPVEDPPQLRQHAVLALHVVGAGRHDPERRPAQHQLGVAEAQQVREVGRAVRELQGRELARQLGQVGAQVGLQRRPVELLAGTDRRASRGRPRSQLCRRGAR